MTAHDSASFSAGHEAGVRVSACVARLAALQLVQEARWWNRWRRRLMARALVACADELDQTADATGRQGDGASAPEAAVPSPVALADHRARAPRAGRTPAAPGALGARSER